MDNTSRPRIPKGFVTETIGALSRIEQAQKATNEHLKTLNGRTGKSEDRLTAIEMKLAEQAGREAGEEKANGRWHERLKPFLPWMVAGAMSFALTNGPRIVAALEGAKGLVKAE